MLNIMCTVLMANFPMFKSFKKLLLLTSIYSIGNLLLQVISIIFLPIFTRYLTPKDFGIQALMILIISLLTGVIISPVNSAVNRFYFKPDHVEKRDILLFSLFSYLFITVLILTSVYILFSNLLTKLLFESSELEVVTKVYAFVLFTLPLRQFFLNFLQLLEKAKYYVLVITLRTILYSVVTLLLLIKYKLGILSLIYGQIAGNVLIIVLTISYFLARARFSFSLKVIKKPLAYGYPLILSNYSHLLLESGDRFLLKWLTSLSTLGIYDFGYKISSINKIILSGPISQALRPVAFKKEHNVDDQRRLLKKGATYFYLIGVLFAFAFSLYSKEIIMLLSSNTTFYSSWVIVPILSFSYVQLSLGSFLGIGLIMKNRSILIATIITSAVILNLILNLIFIPLLGIVGAALATLLSYIFWNSLKIYYSSKLYALHFELNRLLYITVVAVTIFIFAIYLSSTCTIILGALVKFVFLISFFPFFIFSPFFDKKEKAHIHTAIMNLPILLMQKK